MISPTLVMETELDTASDSDDGDDHTTNIYEEVLNEDNHNTRQFHSRLSTTSSLYSSGGWNWERRDPAISYYHKVEEQIIHFQFLFIILSFQHLLFQSVPLANTAKAKLSRTTKSSPITNLNNYKASLLNTKSNSDREERQVKSIKKTLSEKLSNLRVHK